jgi:alkylhydroperoxidase/carboxymuconolactone decarboxylase family protein YurZ
MPSGLQVSNSFQVFLEQAPAHAKAWMTAAEGLAQASALEPKTRALCYLSVVAALRLTSGLPFHVKQAKALGAKREEVVSAMLVGLPAAGNAVVAGLPEALAAYDEA